MDLVPKVKGWTKKMMVLIIRKTNLNMSRLDVKGLYCEMTIK